MPTAYTVQRGDSLSVIAKRHGLGSRREFHGDLGAANVRPRRLERNLTFPGGAP